LVKPSDLYSLLVSGRRKITFFWWIVPVKELDTFVRLASFLCREILLTIMRLSLSSYANVQSKNLNALIAVG